MYNHDKTFPNDRLPLTQTDPDFIERFDHFVLHEVANQDDLDDRTRMMAIVATLIGCQGIDEFQVYFP